MARPIIGKMRVVVVPIPDGHSDMTLEEYKEVTGIDLRDVFEIYIPDQGEIGVDMKDNRTLVLFADEGYNRLMPMNCYEQISQINPGTTDAITQIGYGIFDISNGMMASGAGLQFRIDKDDYMSFDTLRIDTFEI